MSVFTNPISPLIGTGNALDAAQGKVALVVNVASKCGLTPQYSALQAIQERYADRGFTVLGVPCNQFMGQEPGTADEISEFCSTSYNVTFPLTEKVDVNGDARHPLYATLADVADGEGYSGDIRWNFEKFVVDRSGSVVARFHPKTAPDDSAVVAAIEAALSA
jgi:glutathione peroxidase